MFTENVQSKSCPKCGYVLEPQDTECPKCAHLRQPRSTTKEPLSKGTLFTCVLFLALDVVLALWVLKNGVMLPSELPAVRRINGTEFDNALLSYGIVNLLLGIPAVVRIFGFIGFLLRRRSGSVAIFIGYLLEVLGLCWISLHLIPLLLDVQRWYGMFLSDDEYAGMNRSLIAILWLGWTVLRLLPALIMRSTVMRNWSKQDAPAPEDREK